MAKLYALVLVFDLMVSAANNECC
eukprot:SAG11_NODE_35302_length_267_cov_0.619048_1_plen_23_part_01